MYSAARDHHERICAWLASTNSDTERRRLNALASGTGGFVGFLTYDLGQCELAIGHYRVAAAHASRAGDISSCCETWTSPMVRGSAEVLTASARMSIAHHDLDQARHLVDQAIFITATTGSTRTSVSVGGRLVADVVRDGGRWRKALSGRATIWKAAAGEIVPGGGTVHRAARRAAGYGEAR
ncbi:hypothetical protein ACE1SV_00420 [Streptomyces sp. E-15]